MKMSATTRATCKCCRRHKSEVGPITWAGYCADCGKFIYLANLDNLHDKSGPYWVHYLRRSFMAARKQLLAAEREAVTSD